MSNQLSVVQYFQQPAVMENIQQTLAEKTPQFIASVSSLAASNKKLAECNKKTLMSACLIAATLDLPINPSLGFAYIIPYDRNSKAIVDGREVWTKILEAQFQMGWKGYVQLAQRSGQFRTINTTDVRTGEITGIDRLTGEMSFEWEPEDFRKTRNVIGYVAYFELLNGFQKTLYMTNDELVAHATKYSKAYRSEKGGMNVWKDDFDSMAKKTVLKLLIAKFGPMSVDMQKAITADQSVEVGNQVEYPDNPNELEERTEEAEIKSRALTMGSLRKKDPKEKIEIISQGEITIDEVEAL